MNIGGEPDRICLVDMSEAGEYPQRRDGLFGARARALSAEDVHQNVAADRHCLASPDRVSHHSRSRSGSGGPRYGSDVITPVTAMFEKVRRAALLLLLLVLSAVQTPQAANASQSSLAWQSALSLSPVISPEAPSLAGDNLAATEIVAGDGPVPGEILILAVEVRPSVPLLSKQRFLLPPSRAPPGLGSSHYFQARAPPQF